MAYPTPASSEIEEMEMENQRSPLATWDGASSSSTAADSLRCVNKYDVFINHRGEVKKNFASHLYRALVSRGLKPFLDQQNLQEGLPFPSQLEAVISKASLHVAIFSPKYAESRWCLHELVLMLQSGAPIIPVFYHVKPADLRWGVYALSLHHLELKKTLDPQTQQEKVRYDPATIQKWRDALSSVADKNGFDLNGKYNGDEVYMIDKIVEHVVKIIKKPGMYVAQHPTGLDEKVTDFEATVFKQQHDAKIQVAGIVGLGGMGKTTLALELFNRMSSKYNKSFFLSDVREKANKSSLHSVQRELLRGLTQGLPERELDINNIYEGIGKLEKHLKSDHVLLILDDIDHDLQLEALLSFRNVLRVDSFILITSRYKDVLERSIIEELCIYKLTGLSREHSQQLFCAHAFSREHSQQLFCSHAFCQTNPWSGFEDLVNQFLEVCDGMPLALKVIGALLFRKPVTYWDAKLFELKIQIKVSSDIKSRLKISYDALKPEERKMFLDIAFFFIGENKTSAITVWDASGWNGLVGLTNLEGKCLVEVDDQNVIHMHDQLRDLGRDIAEEESPRHLWRPTGNIDDWLHKYSSVIMEARGIRMLGQVYGMERLAWYQRWSHQMLGNRVILKLRNRLPRFDVMNLQLVETQGHLLDRILRVHSPNLLWLSWSHCPYTRLPSWITIKNLRFLRVEGGVLETLWEGISQVNLNFLSSSVFKGSPMISDGLQSFLLSKCLILQAPLQLQELEIIDASCVSRIPKSIGQLKHLEKIVIECPSLAKLPQEFGDLNSLKALVLHAPTLKSLPNSFGKLRNLYHVDLYTCFQLERLPDSFGSLTNLHSLNVSSCSQLERLPDSFGSLSNLHSLYLSYCRQLERLPDSFGSLSNLHSLDLKWCRKLKRLPDSFGSLSNLHSLDLSQCSELGRLPDSFGSLSNLHSLDLKWCFQLERLPDSFGSLTNLDILDLSHFYELERLPDSFGSLSNLHSLDLQWCRKLERLPDSFGSLSKLHRLYLSRCYQLERLPDSFGSLSNLHSLNLKCCSQLQGLADCFGSLSSLEYFDVSEASNLRISSETFGNIRTLKHIDLTNCEKVEVWPWQLGHQRSLKVLKLTGTNFMEELPRAFDLPGDLEVLWIGNPLLDTVIPSLGDLRKLKDLHLEFRGELNCLSASVERSNELSWLKVCGCPIIHTSELFYESNVVYPKLKELILEECINLVEVGTLPKALTEVTLIGCDNLRSIEGLCGLPRLRLVFIERCNELQVPPSVEETLKQNSVFVVRL